MTPVLSKGWETSPVMKERGCQEAIAMVEKFWNLKEVKQNNEVVTQKTERNQQAQGATRVQEAQKRHTHVSEELIENRQQKDKEY